MSLTTNALVRLQAKLRRDGGQLRADETRVVVRAVRREREGAMRLDALAEVAVAAVAVAVVAAQTGASQW